MSVIGMDISSNRIAVAEIAKKRNSFAVLNAAVFELPYQVIEMGEIKDSKVVSRAVKEIWKHYRFGGRKVLVGLSNPKVIIKEIQLPVTGESDIKSSIELQINDLVPIERNNLTYDYYVSEKNKEYSRIMIAGAAKNMIDSIIESLRDVKICAAAVDLNCFSLYRVINHICGFKKPKDQDEKTAYCMVNIGKDISIINMVTEDGLKFPRFSNISTLAFVGSVSAKLELDYSATEQMLDSFDFSQAIDIKFDRTIESEPKPIGPVKPADSQQMDASMAFKEAGNLIIEEINRSIDYFINRYPSYNLQKIFISGDAFNNFGKFIETEMDYKVEQINIEDHFSLDRLKKKDFYKNKPLGLLGNQLTLAIGMGLRGFGI